MKKIALLFAVLSAAVLLLTSCESRKDKQIRAAHAEASRAAANADRAKQEYEDLSEDISNYYRLRDALDNAK